MTTAGLVWPVRRASWSHRPTAPTAPGTSRRRTELARPEFNDGVTRVFGIARFDPNQDAADDTLICTSATGLGGGWTGRFIQALLNAGDGRFVDQTSTWILSDQGVTSRASNLGGMAMHDVDLDGCLDLLVTAR